MMNLRNTKLAKYHDMFYDLSDCCCNSIFIDFKSFLKAIPIKGIVLMWSKGAFLLAKATYKINLSSENA